ncbi:hypothetical protein AG1IA_09416 [Rhizoctonia solani AG-1 IA]|uniref:Uncharacterized protein n=1 Tax=Thanatephorus cucumeris (strain AG1-IA) TaxID=983506 RepID=L8WIC8_THACA|nr:hypothetical protein AG1IA_09416 [Rhizoctonia solani AG-1 IA]
MPGYGQKRQMRVLLCAINACWSGMKCSGWSGEYPIKCIEGCTVCHRSEAFERFVIKALQGRYHGPEIRGQRQDNRSEIHQIPDGAWTGPHMVKSS